jgi:DDB1- and CUL4-associated factor 13
MATSVYFPLSQRPNGYREKGRMSNGLPSYSPSVVQEKFRHTRASSWIIPIYVPIPGMQTRRLRVPVPNPARFHQLTVSRFGRKRGTLVLCLSVLAMVFTVFALAKRFGSEDREWPKFPGEPPTLVFRREDLQRIWKWEVESGHYPSSQKSE